MAVSRPVICARCSYDLEGLPPPHRCPECGLEYDEHTRIWRPVSSWNFYLFAGVMHIVVLWNVLRSAYRFAGAPSWRLGMPLFFFAAVSIVLFLWLRDVNRNRRGRFAAITPKALFACSGSDLVEMPWNKFDVATSHRFGVLQIKELGRRSPHEFHTIFDSRQEMDEFCRSCAEAKTRYADQPTAGKAP